MSSLTTTEDPLTVRSVLESTCMCKHNAALVHFTSEILRLFPELRFLEQ